MPKNSCSLDRSWSRSMRPRIPFARLSATARSSSCNSSPILMLDWILSNITVQPSFRIFGSEKTSGNPNSTSSQRKTSNISLMSSSHSRALTWRAPPKTRVLTLKWKLQKVWLKASPIATAATVTPKIYSFLYREPVRVHSRKLQPTRKTQSASGHRSLSRSGSPRISTCSSQCSRCSAKSSWLRTV